jgi:hypothetical protein
MINILDSVRTIQASDLNDPWPRYACAQLARVGFGPSAGLILPSCRGFLPIVVACCAWPDSFSAPEALEQP